ncbi:MAG: GNAT family N-acetyltransferase [Bacteriovorax sp.]|nr:GNAT family N-acetyltransferase [Bacteriovorax sp.]
MIEISKINTIEDKMEFEDIVFQVKSIFYASSSLKEFSSPERKEAFFKRWCGDYISLFPEQFTLMTEDKKVLGYLSGCMDSSSAISVLEVPGFNLFSDLFRSYPAHFHINFRPDCRGRGLGSQLVEGYCEDLREQGITGVHLVTSPGAANIIFYQRLSFRHEVKREFNQMCLLLMGRLLE